MMETWAPQCTALPADTTGRGKSQASLPTGSLGIAISEGGGGGGRGTTDTKILARLRAQPRVPAPTVIGKEAMAQMGMAARSPTWWWVEWRRLELRGLSFPLHPARVRGGQHALPSAETRGPTLTPHGVYHYDFGDTAA